MDGRESTSRAPSPGPWLRTRAHRHWAGRTGTLRNMITSTNCQLGKDISDDIGRQTGPVVGTGWDGQSHFTRASPGSPGRCRGCAGSEWVLSTGHDRPHDRGIAWPGRSHCCQADPRQRLATKKKKAWHMACRGKQGESFFLLGQRVTRSRPMRLGGAVTTINPGSSQPIPAQPKRRRARGGRERGLVGSLTTRTMMTTTSTTTTTTRTDGTEELDGRPKQDRTSQAMGTQRDSPGTTGGQDRKSDEHRLAVPDRQ